MANLNLSEFTEKLFVTDADHTFIWDAAGAISKRVSRNSWLNSGTLTSDAPVTISQTWNNAAVAFTGLKVVATDTASGAASNLLELWSGNAATLKVNVDKSGNIIIPNLSVIRPRGIYGNSGIVLGAGGSFTEHIISLQSINGAGVTFGAGRAPSGNSYVVFNNNSILGWVSGTDVGTGNPSPDTILLRDGAPNTLALRNGTTAQTFNVYGTWTTAITNFERLAIKYNATDVAYQIAAEKGSTNGDYRPLQLWTGGASRLNITTAGNVGIGTTSPTSKLQVTGGDVEIETVTSGIIMKAAGTATRYRITLNAGGTDLVFTAI